MIRTKFGERTINGLNRADFDEVNIAGEIDSLTIDDNEGSAGQVLCKNSITNKLEFNSVPIANDTITTNMIQDLQITNDKIANTTIQNGKIADATIEGGKLATDINITTTGGIEVHNLVANNDLVVDGNVNLNGGFITLGNAGTDTIITKGNIIFQDGATARGTFLASTGELTIPSLEVNGGATLGNNNELQVVDGVGATFNNDVIFGGEIQMSVGGTEVFNLNSHNLTNGGDATFNNLTLTTGLNLSNNDLDLGSGDFECNNIVCNDILGTNFSITQGSISLQLSGVAQITMNHTNGIITCKGLGTAGGNLNTNTGNIETNGGYVDTNGGNVSMNNGDIIGADEVNCNSLVGGTLQGSSLTTTTGDITANQGDIVATIGNITADYPGTTATFYKISTQDSSTLAGNYSSIPTLKVNYLNMEDLFSGTNDPQILFPVSPSIHTGIEMGNNGITQVSHFQVDKIYPYTLDTLEIGADTDQVITFKNRNIRMSEPTDDNNYITKYRDSFEINTQNITAGSGGFEYYDNSCSWFVADLDEMDTGPFTPAYTGAGTTPGVRQSGTGTGSTGGFATYPHIDFRGPGVSGQRVCYSKRFPKYALSDIERFKIRVIQGNNSNGGENCDSGDNLFIVWSDNTGDFDTLPTSSSAATNDYWIQLVSGASTLYHSWTLLTYTLDSDFTATQKTNFQQARRIAFVATHTGSASSDFDHYGITDIEFQTTNEQVVDDDNLSKLVEGPAMIGKTSNRNYTKANGLSFSTLSGGWAYLGLNYTNGWYYEQLDLSKFIADDDNNSPSSMSIFEPSVSVAGTTDNGGLVLNGTNHTQVYYTFNCPPGYAIVGYYISLNSSTGVRINPNTHNSGFYNHLIQAHSGYVNDGANLSKIISQTTDTNGNAKSGQTTSYNGFNIEVPVYHKPGGNYPVYSNTFQGKFGSEQFGKWSDLRNWKQYYIMCFASASWSNAYRFKGGYIKYRRLDPGES